jgi:raffinose/stachyose/melibiose transport system permease protein
MQRIRDWLQHLLTITFTLLWICPFFYMLNVALKSQGDYNTNGPLGMPRGVAWSNFADAGSVLLPYFLNSVRYVAISLPIVLLLTIPAAYALARMQFRFRVFISVYLMIGLMFPLVISIIPLYILYKELGLLGSIWCLVISYVTSQISYTIYLLRGYMIGIPSALEEAGLIDGCSRLALLAHIIMPLSRPIILTAVIVDFFAIWNDFFLAYTFQQQGAYQPLQLSLFQFETAFSVNYDEMSAALILMVLPTLFIFLVFQPYIMQRMRAGALKE